MNQFVNWLIGTPGVEFPFFTGPAWDRVIEGLNHGLTELNKLGGIYEDNEHDCHLVFGYGEKSCDHPIHGPAL